MFRQRPHEESEHKQPLASTSEIQVNHKQRLLSRQYWATWPGTASVSFFVAVFAFAFNSGVFIWALTSPQRNGFAVIYTGDLDTAKKIELASKLIINVISTAIFVSSNRCVQYLCAPTRQDLDRCHKQGRWLDIGIRSFRNFRQLRGWRMWLSLVLIASSLPIHYLYNSAIIVSLAGHNYVALTVNPAFTEGAKWNSSAIPSALPASTQASYTDLALKLQSEATAGNLTSLEPHECAQAYAVAYQSDWRNLLVVSEAEELENSSAGIVANFQPCHVPSVGVVMSHWWASEFNFPSSSVFVPPLSEDVDAYGLDCILEANKTCNTAGNSFSKVKVTQCLVEQAPEDNAVCISIGFLALVLLATAAKALCLFWARRRQDYVPLLTTGDAIASFLQDPDPCTAGWGPLDVSNVKQGMSSMKVRPLPYQAPWKRYRLFQAPAPFRWWSAMLSLLIPLAVPAIGIYWNAVATRQQYEDNDSLVITPGSDLNFNNPAIITMKNSFVEVALAANLAQLLLTYIYYLVNDLLTSIIIVREYHLHGLKHNTLRVTRPRGNQRSTYWLNLPLKFAVPMIIIWLVFHWITSIEISAVKVDIYDYQGDYDIERSYTGLALKATGMLGIACADVFLILALLILGCLKLQRGMPLARTCSLAISAACHRRPEESDDLAQQSLKYGVLPNTYSGEFQCVGFSTEDVQPLVPGSIYTSYREIQDDWAWGQGKVADDTFGGGGQHHDGIELREMEAEQALMPMYTSSPLGTSNAGKR